MYPFRRRDLGDSVSLNTIIIEPVHEISKNVVKGLRGFSKFEHYNN